MPHPIKFIREVIWADLPDAPTAGQRRIAALAWGGGLVLLGLFFAWNRHRHGEVIARLPWIVGGLGPVLSIALIIPRLGPATYLGVMRTVSVVGFCVFTVILTVVFYLVMTPMGWVLRLFGKNQIAKSEKLGPLWSAHRTREGRRHYHRLF